jgi:LmbE family N-acetylglucosaminyl deacetylase
MATILFLHAHPDDECLISGGTIAKYSAEGHRTVLVTATDGRHGERPVDVATPEALIERRRSELGRACEALGVARHEWLGYADSGMTGWPQNNDDGAFIRSDIDEAAARLVRIIAEEQRATDRFVLVTYDWHGNYGHPDHLHVHKVGHRAAQLAGVRDLFEVTLNRDFYVEQFEWSKANGGDNDFDPRQPADDGNPMGEPEGNITHHIDVGDHCDATPVLRRSCRRNRSVAPSVRSGSFVSEPRPRRGSRRCSTDGTSVHGATRARCCGMGYCPRSGAR